MRRKKLRLWQSMVERMFQPSKPKRFAKFRKGKISIGYTSAFGVDWFNREEIKAARLEAERKRNAAMMEVHQHRFLC